MITLTDSASAKVAELLREEGEDELSLRVGVRPGGCAGFNYEMHFDIKSEGDVEQMFGGVSVIADSVSAGLLDGASLEYYDGLESGFKIVNTKASKTCGCGKSFC